MYLWVKTKLFLTNGAWLSRVFSLIRAHLHTLPLLGCKQLTWCLHQSKALCQCEWWGYGVKRVLPLRATAWQNNTLPLLLCMNPVLTDILIRQLIN